MNPLSKTFRFQFTLRTILIGFAIISLALVVYRSPWEETTDELLNWKTVTTFRRSWVGHKLRHGPEREYFIGKDNVECLKQIHEYFDDHRLSSRQVDVNGRVVLKLHFKDDVPNGPFLDEYEHLHLSGQFENGKKTGDWKYLYKWQGETIKVSQHFEKDIPAGKWRWQSTAGLELQTANFE